MPENKVLALNNASQCLFNATRLTLMAPTFFFASSMSRIYRHTSVLTGWVDDRKFNGRYFRISDCKEFPGFGIFRELVNVDETRGFCSRTRSSRVGSNLLEPDYRQNLFGDIESSLSPTSVPVIHSFLFSLASCSPLSDLVSLVPQLSFRAPCVEVETSSITSFRWRAWRSNLSCRLMFLSATRDV
jgi:hypothetical protein